MNDEGFWQAIWCCCLHAVHWNLGKTNYLEITCQWCKTGFEQGKLCKILGALSEWIWFIFDWRLNNSVIALTQQELIRLSSFYTCTLEGQQTALYLTAAMWKISTVKLNFHVSFLFLFPLPSLRACRALGCCTVPSLTSSMAGFRCPKGRSIMKASP